MLQRFKANNFQNFIWNPIDFWQEVSVIFRWSAPTEPNGIIQRYELSCWVTYNFTNSSRTSCSSTQISTKSLEFTLQNLPTNKIHNFQVSFSPHKLIILVGYMAMHACQSSLPDISPHIVRYGIIYCDFICCSIIFRGIIRYGITFVDKEKYVHSPKRTEICFRASSDEQFLIDV